MAYKICFLTNEDTYYTEENVEFTYVKGMAFSQKKKNVLSFHSSIQKIFPDKKILEVSTKSNCELGVKLSAFNLKLNGYCIENIFQSSKVFEGNIQHSDILFLNPGEAKKAIREENGHLSCFKYNGVVFPLEPPSMFYDYIYIKALMENKELSERLIGYDIFTDIEFNSKKSINCQARACAIYASLLKKNSADDFVKDLDSFGKLYIPNENEQISFFD